MSPEAYFKEAGAIANKLKLGSNEVIEESQNVLLGEYTLPADMVRSVGEAREITPSCAGSAARRTGDKAVCDIC